MASVECAGRQVKLHELVAELTAQGRAASVAQKARLLQARLVGVVAEQAGRGPGERGRPPEEALSAWRCSRCGSQRQCDFNYNGSYQRRVVFAEGCARLRIPRLRCRCGGNVPADFGAALPARLRHWYDLMLEVLGLLVEGCSLRAVQRHLTRRRVQVGLSSLARVLGRCEQVDISSELAAGLEAISLDAAFWRVQGGQRAHLCVHEVRRREQPLVREGRQVAWYRTGKVLAVGVAEEETQSAWEEVLEQAIPSGSPPSSQELFVASDGNGGLLGAVDLQLPWSIRQRCVWHIAYRTRDKVLRAEHRERLQRDALWVFGAGDLSLARDRLARFLERWGALEPEAAESVRRKFEGGVQYLREPVRAVRPRTIAINERYNQEAKRRLRPGRSFGSERNLQAMLRLLALRHNCILDGTDWLQRAAEWLWPMPATAPTAQQQQRPPTPPYTNEGT
jgi:hypothetical protein